MAVTIAHLPEKVNIKLYKGDDLRIKLKWYTDSSKTSLLDLSGSTARMQVRDPETNQVLYDLGSNVVLSDGSSGHNIEIRFPKTDTTTFTWEEGQYDFEYTDSLGDTRTLFVGTIQVVTDITQ